MPFTDVIKHLQGQHDQHSHGKGGGQPVVQPSSGGKAAVGVHVKKLVGDKAAAAGHLTEIDSVDKTFGGEVSKFLEKHPLDSIYVGKSTEMGSSDGTYNPSSKKLSVKPASEVQEPWLMDAGSMTVIHGQKTDSREDMMKAAFVHELGHHIALTTIKNSPGGPEGIYKKTIINSYQKDNKKVSEYAATHPHEYFAESFTAYHFAPKSLSSTAKKMVEDIMSRAGEL